MLVLSQSENVLHASHGVGLADDTVNNASVVWSNAMVPINQSGNKHATQRGYHYPLIQPARTSIVILNKGDAVVPYMFSE